MRVARLFATVAAASAAGLTLATPALADGTTLPIHGTQVPTTAQQFGGNGCDGPLDNLPDAKDGWHFIMPGQNSFTSLMLKFHTSGSDVTVNITTGTQASPNTGAGWSGFFDNAGSADKHAYVITDAGWTLFDGSAVVNLTDKHDFFNLSHTCVGKADDGDDGTPSGSPSPSKPGTPGETPSPGTSTSPSGDGGNLPRTGTATSAIIIGGVALVAGGVALLAIRRRRDTIGD